MSSGIYPPIGHFFCCLCFEIISVNDAWVDASGDRWDFCVPCKTNEDVQMRLLGREGEIQR